MLACDLGENRLFVQKKTESTSDHQLRINLKRGNLNHWSLL
jgi:hypothetical protein